MEMGSCKYVGKKFTSCLSIESWWKYTSLLKYKTNSFSPIKYEIIVAIKLNGVLNILLEISIDNYESVYLLRVNM